MQSAPDYGDLTGYEPISDADRKEFLEQGFLLVRNVLTEEHRAKLEEAVDRLTFVFRGRTITAGASAGVAILGPHDELGRALEEADSAMYVRKAQRRHEV